LRDQRLVWRYLRYRRLTSSQQQTRIPYWCRSTSFDESEGAMTVFYRSKELVINNEAMVELLSAQRFALSDLSRVHVTDRDNDQYSGAATPAMAGALVVAAATGTFVHSPAGWVATALAIVALLCFGGLSRLTRRPRLQLLAMYHGNTVCLFSTTDAQTFGQVRRGLLRALEANQRR
jgi:hypothetical protein